MVKKGYDRKESGMKELTPVRAIRVKCLECQGNHYKEVRNCPSTDCPLHTFRLGKNPNRKGIGGIGSEKAFALVKTADTS